MVSVYWAYLYCIYLDPPLCWCLLVFISATSFLVNMESGRIPSFPLFVSHMYMWRCCIFIFIINSGLYRKVILLVQMIGIAKKSQNQLGIAERQKVQHVHPLILPSFSPLPLLPSFSLLPLPLLPSPLYMNPARCSCTALVLLSLSRVLNMMK